MLLQYADRRFIVAITNEPLFKTKAGLAFSAFRPESISRMHSALSELGITNTQIVEAASYSFAMVARFALGLSALGGKVCAVVGDCRAGYTALATLRHLVNSGAEGIILTLTDATKGSSDFKQQLLPLSKMGVPIALIDDASATSNLAQTVGDSHNVLCGLFGATDGVAITPALIERLNELQTPIHSVEAPIGVDLVTGAINGTPLFASSTLSLGAPFSGLHKGHEYAGRHYLCDISFTKSIYLAEGHDLAPIFSEQPVTQILPVLEDEIPQS